MHNIELFSASINSSIYSVHLYLFLSMGRCDPSTATHRHADNGGNNHYLLFVEVTKAALRGELLTLARNPVTDALELTPWLHW